MPDRKKILYELEHQVADADWCDNDWKDNVPIWMLRGALALLREQEPVKPVNGWDYGFYYTCGSCGKTLGIVLPVYCPHCGKKVMRDD